MYLDEVEKYFIKKRKKSLILSPKDWIIIEKWYTIGIPLKIIKQGIDTGFEYFYSKDENRNRSLNTIRYCEPIILDLWQEYKENMVGRNDYEETFDEHKYILNKLAELKNNLEKSGTYVKLQKNEQLLMLLRDLYQEIKIIEKNFIKKEITPFVLEENLYSLKQNFAQKVPNLIPLELLKKIKENANGKLKKYINKMSEKSFKKTLNIVIFKNICEYYKIPDILI